MSEHFVELETLVTERCCNCGVLFAMPKAFQSECLEIGKSKSFYCPNGHGQHYTKGEAQRQRERAEAAERRAQEEQHKRLMAEGARDHASRKYARIRDRVKNGVCPCCNRSFENLRRHIADKHPNFGTDKTLRALRETYGLTQADLAQEVGLSAAAVSQFENGKVRPGTWTYEALSDWVEQQ